MKKIDIYKKIAPNYTNHELAAILDVSERTIRKYALKTQIKFKTNKFRKTSPNKQIQQFNEHYKNKLYAKFLYKNKDGLVIGQIRCLKCNTIWNAAILPKLRYNTGCIKCDKGNFGNKYSKQEVENKLNQLHKNQWKLIKYGDYSKKNNIIECQFCKKQVTVNLSDMINTTYMRCNYCQTGSFGEYIIKNILNYNNIPFEEQFIVPIQNKKLRIDFFIYPNIAIEYQGKQHNNKGAYYNEQINKNMKIKKNYCVKNNIQFYEIWDEFNAQNILENLKKILQIPLKFPDNEYMTNRNPNMKTVLQYMRTHSARQTERHFKIPKTKIQKYVKLTGYESISDWQSENKIK